MGIVPKEWDKEAVARRKLEPGQKLERKSEADQVLERGPCQLVGLFGYLFVYLRKGYLWGPGRWKDCRIHWTVVVFVEVILLGI